MGFGYQGKKKRGQHQRHLTKEIKEGIRQLIDGTGDGRKVAKQIKRTYLMVQERSSMNSTANMEFLKSTIGIIMHDYDKLREYDSINEMVQLMLEQYEKSLEGLSGEQCKAEEQHVFKTRSRILGNPGTNSKDMPISYIERIVNEKIKQANGVIGSDIINLLEQQEDKMYVDAEKYQSLINSTVVTVVDSHNEGTDSMSLTEPRILSILANLARSYRVQKNDEAALRIYEKALELHELKDSREYSELEAEYVICKEYVQTVSENFGIAFIEDGTTFDNIASYEEFLRMLKGGKEVIKLIQRQDEIFYAKDKKNGKSLSENQSTDVSINIQDSSNVMDNESKFKAIQLFVKRLKSMGYTVTVKEVMIGKGGYEGYIIFPLEGTYLSALEKFNEREYSAFYLMLDSERDIMTALRRSDAKKEKTVEAVNHDTGNFNKYVDKMKEKAIKLMDKIGHKPNKAFGNSARPESPRVARLRRIEEQRAALHRAEQKEADLKAKQKDTILKGNKEPIGNLNK